MGWVEISPLPIECRECKEEDCYNCDFAEKRWRLPKEEELRIRRKGIVKAIERLQQRLIAIDYEISLLANNDESTEDYKSSKS